MKALIGRKIGMTQILSEEGIAIPVTLVQAGPCTVVQIKSVESDGYEAVALGFETASKLAKPLAGHVKDSKAMPKVIREFRITPTEGAAEVGSSFDVEAFEVGDVVKISGESKGKGFTGTIRRHNFARGPKSHGSRNYRAPGSIGSMYPQKIFKGKRMSGHHGNLQVTVKNVRIELVDKELNVIGIRGALPGPRKSLITIEGAN